jgi:hypothetical protein
MTLLWLSEKNPSFFFWMPGKSLTLGVRTNLAAAQLTKNYRKLSHTLAIKDGAIRWGSPYR